MRLRYALALLLLASWRPAPAAEPTVEVRKGEEITFRVGKALVARYVIAPTAPKPYFWPLHCPSGGELTRPYPMGPLDKGEKADHPHHRSAWFCHGDVIPVGMELKHKVRNVTGVDFWAEGKNQGRIVCTHVGPVKQEKGHAWVVTRNEWRTAGGVKVLDETRTIHLYTLAGGWLLVLDSDLAATVVPIVFGDTKEGSMGIRVRDVMRADKKGTLTNAEGKSGEGKAPLNADRRGCWGLVSAWCDYSGPVGEKTAGIAVLADPRNSVPTAWHARNYGLLAANPFGRARSGFPGTKGKKELVRLAKGEHLRLRYALFLHDGDVKSGRVAEAYAEFARLPRD
jgi:hypothetical protein